VLVPVLAFLFVTSSSFAQKQYTYTPTGPVTLLTGGGYQRTQLISIKNEGNTNLTLKIRYQGDTNIRFGYAPWETFTLGVDSGATFPIYYHGWSGDTSRGFLRIYDSVNTADTIHFTGIDTGDVFMPWEISTFDPRAGSYYSKDDTIRIPIHNNKNDSCYVTSSLTNDSYGFTALGSQQRTIVANGTTTFKYLYNSATHTVANATVHFQGEGIIKTAGMQGRSTVPPRDSLRLSGNIDFGSIAPGDTLCKTFTIYNHMDTAASLTSLSVLQNSGFYIANAPSLPHTIDAYDSLEITVCFIAPVQSGTGANGYVTVNYSFGNWQSSATINLHGSSLSCFRASTDGINFGSVIRDQSVTRSLYIVNLRNETTMVDLSLNPSGTGFEILTSSPVTIPAYDTAEVEVRFTASSNTYHSAKLVMDGRDSCGQVEAWLIGRIDDSTIVLDSNSIPLYGDEERLLSFEGDSTNLIGRYVFYNNQSDSITIKSVLLKHGDHFTITNIQPRYPEFKLDSGGGMAVIIEFDNEPGTYADTLIIETETGFIAISFPMRAVIHGTSDVRSQGFATPAMMVSPNPSMGPITISIADAKTATIEVLDIMGKRITRFNDTRVIFDRADIAGGTYFVRVSGIGIDGKPFVITQRIVLK
jgi:hypothetical protein